MYFSYVRMVYIYVHSWGSFVISWLNQNVWNNFKFGTISSRFTENEIGAEKQYLTFNHVHFRWLSFPSTCSCWFSDKVFYCRLCTQSQKLKMSLHYAAKIHHCFRLLNSTAYDKSTKLRLFDNNNSEIEIRKTLVGNKSF